MRKYNLGPRLENPDSAIEYFKEQYVGMLPQVLKLQVITKAVSISI